MADVLTRKRERKDGTVWEYRFEIAMMDGQRKWVSKSGYKTKTEAKEAGKLAQKTYEQTGVPVKPTDMSFGDWLDYYIEHEAKLKCKEVTIKGYEKKIRLYIKPALGQYRLRSIRKRNIQDLITKMYNDGFGHNTLTSVKGILNKAFDFAMDDDNNYISFNPCASVKIPKSTALVPDNETRVEPHIYCDEEMMKAIFERFPEGQPTHIPLMLGYRCGLRLGEVFGLTWEDIDFTNKTLSINRQVQWHSAGKVGRGGNRRADEKYGYWYFSEPKYKSYRTITLDDELLDQLKKEKEKQDAAKAYYSSVGKFTQYYSDYQIIFGGTLPKKPVIAINKIETEITDHPLNLLLVREDGSYIAPRTLQHTSSIIHHQLGYGDWDFHSLRHTHATMLCDKGAPPIYVKERLGHKNLKTTMNIYANHLTSLSSDKGNAVLNNIF